MIVLCCNDSYWDPQTQAPTPGGIVDVVHGRTMAAMKALGVEACWSRQPLEGHTNVYLWGRSHFNSPRREVSIYIGHGIADKGNWAYQAPRFDLLLAPNWFIAHTAGRKGFSAGIPMLDRWTEPRPHRGRQSGDRIRVVYSTTINPRPHVGNLSSIDQSQAWIDTMGSCDDIDLVVAQHPSQSKRGPGRKALPIETIANADVVVADPGSHLSVAVALGVPVVVPSHLQGVRGSIEEQLMHLVRRADLGTVVDQVRDAADHGPLPFEQSASSMVLDPQHRGVSAQWVAWWLQAVDKQRDKIISGKGSGTRRG